MIPVHSLFVCSKPHRSMLHFKSHSISNPYQALFGVSNTFTLSDSARGDFTVIQQAAFKKGVTITYAKEGGMMEWTFDGIQVNSVLGGGI